MDCSFEARVYFPSLVSKAGPNLAPTRIPPELQNLFKSRFAYMHVILISWGLGSLSTP